MVQRDFESLIAEAEAQPFVGWDFSWLRDQGRMVTEPLPWDYDKLVLKHARQSPDMLDIDTGGGEWLSRLQHRPLLTIATESYPKNVTVAARRLKPLNVSVLHLAPASDNNTQRDDEKQGRLPFREGAFHVVSNRHSSYTPSEVARILAPSGWFITEQLGPPRDSEFFSLLQLQAPESKFETWTLGLAQRQIERGGLRVVGSGIGEELVSFRDVGAFAWYLKAIPWTVPGFSIRSFHDELKALHSQFSTKGMLGIRLPGFWFEAIKPSVRT